VERPLGLQSADVRTNQVVDVTARILRLERGDVDREAAKLEE
jgi:hypothetical protein